jgi:DNA-binding CsgD family transcriptional regulator
MGLAGAAFVVGTGPGLLERESSIEQLNEWFGEAAAGRGRLVLVGGEAGIGKTALVRSFCEQRDRQAPVLWGACDGLRTPRALGPFVDIASATGGGLREVVERGEKPTACFAALVRELAKQSPSIMVLEDIHWADEATLDVLAMLGRRAETVDALSIVTYRDDGLGANDPLRAVLGDLHRESGVRRLFLQPLSLEAVRRLVPSEGLDAAALHERTRGNPFFVTEVLAAGGGEIPATVRDAVLARAAQLLDPARRVLDALAVVPHGVEVWLLEQLLRTEVEHLDECLASGMLGSQDRAVAFRHELARLAVEDAIPAHRRVALHRNVLAALRTSPEGCSEPARIAHHAEAAGDRAAVLEFAPAAAERAAALGAHREAAAQYGRALRFAEGLDPSERGELLERRSDEYFVTALQDEAIADIRAALDCYRALGDRRREANALCSLSRRLYCAGRGQADAPARKAVEVLDGLPPGRELARAYALMASLSMNAEDANGTFEWGPQAVDLAERLGERDILAYALNDLGTMEFLTRGPAARGRLERSLRLSLEEGFEDYAARAFIHLAWAATRVRAHALAADYIREGIDYCTERDLDLYLPYLFTRRASIELDQGHWDSAAEDALHVIRDPRSSPDARAPALAALGLARARRGDPDQWPPLEEARGITAPHANLQALAPVAAAWAEALLLEGGVDEVDRATKVAFELSLQRNVPWVVGELACWRRRAGLRVELPEGAAAGPYALSLSGEPGRAAAMWRKLGCPYEAALALADDDDDERALREALDELHALDARPAAAIVSRRLRERGARGLPRGPRPSTRENPAGITARELDVLELLAEGLRNADIAERLVVSERTVGHHVSAILRKLDVHTRGEASAKAARIGLTAPPPPA